MLCPFECGTDRENAKLGRCGMSAKMRVSRIAPHLWEEPCLSGQGLEMPIKGSGTIFFSGCPIHCVFCQNHRISARATTAGREYTPSELAIEMLRLQSEGVHNINFVTPTHYSPSIVEAVKLAKAGGLTVPTVYNCSGYESTSAIRSLKGTVDIFMPDLKYHSDKLAMQYSNIPNYFDVALPAIKLMQSITGAPRFDTNGFLVSGTIIRHLILPGSDADSRKLVSAIHSEFGSDGIILSLMSQYTPMPNLPFPELTEKLPASAYLRVLDHAQRLGFRYLYSQDGSSAEESFIPV